MVQLEAGQIFDEEVAAQMCSCLLLLIILGVRLLLRLTFAFKSAYRQDPLYSDMLTCDRFYFGAENFKEQTKRPEGSCDSKPTELAPDSSLRDTAESLQAATTIHTAAIDAICQGLCVHSLLQRTEEITVLGSPDIKSRR